MNHPASTYRQHAVQGASPVSLVVMLYDGAIVALQRARRAMEACDIERKCAHVNRALAIICQLEGSLDFEKGGEVAQTLKKFYVHARCRVLQANIQNSREMLASLVEQFSALREAWVQVEHPRSSPPPAIRTGGPPRGSSQASETTSLHLTA